MRAEIYDAAFLIRCVLTGDDEPTNIADDRTGDKVHASYRDVPPAVLEQMEAALGRRDYDGAIKLYVVERFKGTTLRQMEAAAHEVAEQTIAADDDDPDWEEDRQILEEDIITLFHDWFPGGAEK